MADSIWLGVVPPGIHSQFQEAESIPAVPVATPGWLLLLSCSVLILVLDVFPQFLHAKQAGKKKSRCFRQFLSGVGITDSKMQISLSWRGGDGVLYWIWGTQGCTWGVLASNLDREEAAEIPLD